MTTNALPLLSILIPTWNRVDPVLRAIASVGAPPPWVEIVVVDNGSAEEVFMRLKESVGGLDGIKLFRNHENIGMVRNWNRCIELSSGEWLGLLCSDDCYLPMAVGRACALLETVEAPALIIQDPQIRTPVEHWAAGVETARTLTLPIASGNFWHRAVSVTLGGFDERFEYSPDAEFWYRAARHFPVVKVRDCFAHYNRNDSSYMWATWRRPNFLEQTELLARVTLKHCVGPEEYSARVEREVQAGIWNTVLHIVESSLLAPGKQDIFVRYIREACRRATTVRQQRALLSVLLRTFAFRIRSFVFAARGRAVTTMKRHKSLRNLLHLAKRSWTHDEL